MRWATLLVLVACASPASSPSSPPPPPPPPPPLPGAVDAAAAVAIVPDAAPVIVAPDAAYSPPGTCNADRDHCCDGDGRILRVACSPMPRDNTPQRERGDGGWCESCKKKCLPSTASIATPGGAIAVVALRPGDLVWTVDEAGARVAAPVLEVRSVDALADQQVLRITLDDGRVVTGSEGHPTADGRWLGGLAVGEALDGAAIVSIAAVPLGDDATWDLLPAGPTGRYWADGVLLGSTLSE